MNVTNKDMQLYAITDRYWLDGASLTEQVEQVLKAGATFLQLREKDLTHSQMVEEARKIKELTDKYKVPFVINDDIMAAREINADGVHIGQSDMEYNKAREILGPDKIIGISAGTVEQAIQAEKMGADYIGVGAVFHTGTKKDADSISRETLLAIATSVNIPIVAIGGITAENMDYFKDTGIHGVAVISAIFGSKEPGRATKELLQKTKEVFRYE